VRNSSRRHLARRGDHNRVEISGNLDLGRHG
jgi:hypothetical protein